jgi:hypothetical protein
LPRIDRAKRTKAFEKLNNIQELLNNWSYIHAHCINAIYDYNQILNDEQLIPLMESIYTDSDIHIKSVTRSKQYTEILLRHIETNIRDWENKCGSTQEGRLRRRIIRQYYFEQPSNSLHKIANAERKTYAFIREQRDKALKELSALIFGAGGLLKVDGAMYIHTFEETLRSGG